MKKNKKKKATKKPVKKGLKNPSRRKFMINSVLAGAGLSVGGWILYDYLSNKTASHDPWAFLKRPDISPNGNATPEYRKFHFKDKKEITSSYPVVGHISEGELSTIKSDKSIEEIIKIASKTLNKDLSKHVKRAMRFYRVVPDKPEILESAIEYFKKAYDYMSQHPELSDLTFNPVEFVPVKNNSEEYSENLEGKCFVGHSLYTNSGLIFLDIKMNCLKLLMF